MTIRSDVPPDRPSLVIFDCDGVLVDSEPISNAILAEELSAIGLPTSVEDSYRDYLGRSWRTVEEIVRERLGRPLPPGFADRVATRTLGAFSTSIEPVPGVEQALDGLAALGVEACVASSGDHARMAVTLGVTGLAARFEGRIFSATEVERGKPFPDLFLYAARRMGVEPDGCVVVEDSPAGVEAARAAGMRVLGYARLADPTPLARLGAEVFDDMRLVPRLVAGRGALDAGGDRTL